MRIQRQVNTDFAFNRILPKKSYSTFAVLETREGACNAADRKENVNIEGEPIRKGKKRKNTK